MYLFVIPRIIPEFGITSELFFRILVGVGGLVVRQLCITRVRCGINFTSVHEIACVFLKVHIVHIFM